MVWHVDATVFGSPTTNLSQTQSDQFRRMPGDMGRGQFAAFNPTGTIPVNVTYQMNGDTLYQFRQDWYNTTRFNNGANWVTMDLPLMLDHSRQANTTLYPASKDPNTDFTFIVEPQPIYTDADGFISGRLDATNPTGTCAPQYMIDQYVGVLWTNTVQNCFRLRFGGVLNDTGVQLRDNEDGLEVYLPETGESSSMFWDAGLTRYTTPNGATPLAAALWEASTGKPVAAIVKARTQPFQRYTVHPTSAFSPTMNGYDAWSVTIPIEVDMSPKLLGVI